MIPRQSWGKAIRMLVLCRACRGQAESGHFPAWTLPRAVFLNLPLGPSLPTSQTLRSPSRGLLILDFGTLLSVRRLASLKCRKHG